MRGPYQILLSLFSLFLVRVDLTDIFPLSYEVELVRLLDADTAVVKLKNLKFNIRLDKIDAPEKGQPFLNGEGNAGVESLKCAQRIIGNQRWFNLKIHKQDIYGRLLGELDDLNFKFIKAGCVSLYPYAEFYSKHEKWQYIRAYVFARAKKTGLWARAGYLQPKLWRKKFNRRRSS